MKFNKFTDLELGGKRVLIRQDLNVPVKNGKITSTARITASLPTILHAVKAGARVMIMSHLGRPVEGKFDDQFSLKPVAEYLSEELGSTVKLINNYLDSIPLPDEGEVFLLENVRFNTGEKSNDEILSRKYAAMCDVYVMDAFGTAHRAQASTYGAGVYADTACAGPLLSAELEALETAMENPESPVVAIVGGAKVSTKLTVLESLNSVVDQLVPGGGIANTFIAAAGYPVGKSLYEPDLINHALKLMDSARARGAEIPVPEDVVVGKLFSADAQSWTKNVEDVEDDDLILDIGPRTVIRYGEIMSQAKTIIWNGPVGVFEFPQFAEGTKGLGEAIKKSDAFSIAGGGDTLAAIDRFQLADDISYISTGGGAFLEFLEGKALPAVSMLESRFIGK